MILLAEAASRTKKGGQELIGGLDVRVERNHFGRQTESFEADLDLDLLADEDGASARPFRGIFIRAPIVERILPTTDGPQLEEEQRDNTVIAPSKSPVDARALQQARQSVKVRGRLWQESLSSSVNQDIKSAVCEEQGKIVAVQQGNVFGTSFHPELLGDSRIHKWWLGQVFSAVLDRRKGQDIGSD